MNHRVAAFDLLPEHLTHRTVIRRKVRLLDRVAVQRQQRILDDLPDTAQVTGCTEMKTRVDAVEKTGFFMAQHVVARAPRHSAAAQRAPSPVSHGMKWE